MEKNREVPAAVLIVEQRGGVVVVVCGCQQTLAAGVQVGMRLAHARARLVGIEVEVVAHDPVGDKQALTALAQWLRLRFSPVVSLVGGDGICMDIRGCAHLFGGEGALQQAVLKVFARWCVTVRVAIAPTYAAAYAFARYGQQAVTVVEPKALRIALGALPIRAVVFEVATCERMRELGFKRIADLYPIAERQLERRFGNAVIERLHQALGLAFEWIEPLAEHVPLVVEQLFEEPNARWQDLALCVQQLVLELVEQLAAAGLGVRRLGLTCRCVDLDDAVMNVNLTVPSRHARHILDLLRPHIERLHLGAGVEQVVLEAMDCGPCSSFQHRWLHGCEQERVEMAELVDRWTARLGPDRVAALSVRATHWPEDAFRWRKQALKDTVVGQLRSKGDQVLPDRPSMLLPKPEAVSVRVEPVRGHPVCVGRMNGDFEVVAAMGPERIAPCWWTRDASSQLETRDYFKVQLGCGRWWWLFRATTTDRWYLHGEWV